jgi:hypothetical protein
MTTSLMIIADIFKIHVPPARTHAPTVLAALLMAEFRLFTTPLKRIYHDSAELRRPPPITSAHRGRQHFVIDMIFH